MTGRYDINRDLRSWLAARSTTRAPDGLLDAALAQVARTPQRRWWAVVPRWLAWPTERQVLVFRRTVLVLVVLAVLLAIALVLGIGRGVTPGRLVFESGFNVNSVNFDGTDLQSVTAMAGGTPNEPESSERHQVDRNPVWSPDGTKLAFVRLIEKAQIVIVGRGISGGVRKIDIAGVSAPLSWSPDSRQIAFRELDAIHILDIDSGAARTLSLGTESCPQIPVPMPDTGELAYTTGCTDRGVPSWSPDGSSLLVSTRDGDLVTVRIRDGAVAKLALAERPLLNGAWVTRSVANAWSPDGSRVLFIAEAYLDQSMDLQVIDVIRADGSARHRLHEGDRPSWSPDGTLVVFEGESHARGIHVIRPDGGGLRLVVEGESPSWAPDGRQIAYCGVVGDIGGIYRWVIADGAPVLVLATRCPREPISWQAKPG